MMLISTLLPHVSIKAQSHDIAYSQNKELAERHKADAQLSDMAWELSTAADSSIGEKTTAWFVRRKDLLAWGSTFATTTDVKVLAINHLAQNGENSLRL